MGSFELPLLVTEEYWAMTVAQTGAILLLSCVGAVVPVSTFPAIAILVLLLQQPSVMLVGLR
jgi:hypothetical protein